MGHLYYTINTQEIRIENEIKPEFIIDKILSILSSYGYEDNCVIQFTISNISPILTTYDFILDMRGPRLHFYYSNESLISVLPEIIHYEKDAEKTV